MDEVDDDPDDNKVLACALEGKADFIVSGDHHLTDIGSFRGIPIVKPDAFLGIMPGSHKIKCSSSPWHTTLSAQNKGSRPAAFFVSPVIRPDKTVADFRGATKSQAWPLPPLERRRPSPTPAGRRPPSGGFLTCLTSFWRSSPMDLWYFSTVLAASASHW